MAQPLPRPPSGFIRIADCIYELGTGHRPDMRVPVRIFADASQIPDLGRDRSLEQLVNVTTLPGITFAALGMPDMHEGYGFPVGGVAATVLPDGVISPGGIGFDINCGVRLLATPFPRNEIAAHLGALAHELSRSVPTGYGRVGKLALAPNELEQVLAEGCVFLVHDLGLGLSADLEHIESGGRLPNADPLQVSQRARQRGQGQLGTLGGGNHFLEIDVVESILDSSAAAALGLFVGQITVLIHTGSRGLGHQVCTDHVRVMDEAASRLGMHVPDRQLACAPLSSGEGKRYFGAMAAAANFGFCNRQLLTQRVRECFARILGARPQDLRVVYDVGHNTAKIEPYEGRSVCVHRKGATRAFGPSSAELPAAYRGVGQPVFIPGSMGTASYVLVGTDASSKLSLGSACHGAGRVSSRHEAKRRVGQRSIRKELAHDGILVECPSSGELAEEAPLAYKDVDLVVDVTARAGIARKVARLRPLAVLKG